MVSDLDDKLFNTEIRYSQKHKLLVKTLLGSYLGSLDSIEAFKLLDNFS